MAIGLWNSNRQAELADQISALQGELGSLRREAAKRGLQTYEGARDGASELAEMLGDTLGTVRQIMGRRAHQAGGMIRANPGSSAAAAAVVGLMVAGLAASLFLGRGEPGKASTPRPRANPKPSARTAATSAPKRKSAPRKTAAKSEVPAADKSAD